MHTMEHYLITEKNEVSIQAAMWINQIQGKGTKYKDHVLYDFHLYNVSRIDKSTETEVSWWEWGKGD